MRVELGRQVDQPIPGNPIIPPSTADPLASLNDVGSPAPFIRAYPGLLPNAYSYVWILLE
jgi:hypothetical protein